MYLLDTSALLAHCFSEPGADEVDAILASKTAYVAAVTWFELRVKLQGASHATALLQIYADAVAGTIDITREVAEAAFGLRQTVGVRIPAVDSLIAGAAIARGFRLVHRDSHLTAIPLSVLSQIVLPVKSQ